MKMFASDSFPPPPVQFVVKPSENDFVCPPLPPPPSAEDLASYSDTNTSPTKVEDTHQVGHNLQITTPTYKSQTKFNVWTANSTNKTNGDTDESVKSSTAPLAPVGFRSVARPGFKKPENGQAKSSTTTSYTIPNQGLPQQSENMKVTPNHELPEGAVYETQTFEGDRLHTDTYYPTPGEKTVLERTKTTTIIRAEHHQGIGPTDDKGLPVALRSTVENPKAWYKNMFKQIHKFESEDDEQNSNSSEPIEVQNEKPIVSQSAAYKPRRQLGRITNYTPSEHIVENKPKKSNADYSIWSGKKSSDKGSSNAMNSNITNGFDTPCRVAENRIPTASTSYKPSPKQVTEISTKNSNTDPVIHGTDYSLKDSFKMADHVVMEPKHVVTINPAKQKNDIKVERKRQPVKVKFNFVAQSDKQMTLMKEQIVIITRDVNKDWYEGETADGKHSGLFPVAYVEVINHSPARKLRTGQATAKFEFTASNSKQLSMNKGDSIILLEKVDKNWYKGSIDQKTGILPGNYIEVIREPEVKQKSTKEIQSNSKHNTAANTKPANTTQYIHNATVSNSSSNSEPDDKEKMAKASFLAHAVVKSGAHLTTPHERKGEFDIPELNNEEMGPTPTSNNNLHHSPQGSYDTTLSTTSSSQHSELGQNLSKPVNMLSSESSQSSSQGQMLQNSEQNPEDDFPSREKHVAIYPYAPQNEDELELIGGDSVLVVEKCDDGWFVGTCERTGAFGTFPGNYVIPVE